MLGFSSPKHNTRFARVGVLLVLAFGLLLSGCTTAAPTIQAEPSAASMIKFADDAGTLPLATMPHDSAHTLEIPGAALWVHQTYVADTVPYEIGEYVAAINSDRLDVAAAEGEVFLIAEVLGEPASFLPKEPLPGETTEVRVLLNDEEVDLSDDYLAATLTQPNPTVWFMVSIPKDSAPEDVVLEVTHGDRTQQLSLLTGERVRSDIESYYGASFAGSVADTWWEFRDEATFGDDIVTAGLVRGIEVTPVLDGVGWADPDHAFVGVTTEHISQVREFTHSGGLTLTLPDGTVLRPLDSGTDPFGSVEASTTWFQIPIDTHEAVLNIHLNGALADSATVLDFGTVDAEIAFAGLSPE